MTYSKQPTGHEFYIACVGKWLVGSGVHPHLGWGGGGHLTIVPPASLEGDGQLVDLSMMYYLILNTPLKPNKIERCASLLLCKGGAPLCPLVATEDSPQYVDGFCHRVAWPYVYFATIKSVLYLEAN